MKIILVRKIVFVILLIFCSALFAQKNEVKPDPDPTRFQGEIDAFNQWDAKNSTPANAILFVGSSSIRMWPTHTGFPEFPVINRGFGGAHISDVLHFYRTVIKKYQARIIVFYAGDNDVAAGKPVEQVLEDYRQLVDLIKKDNPDGKLVYLPIKPSISRWNFWETMRDVNNRIKAFNQADPNLYYLDLATPMIGASGRPKETLFIEDGLHLNAEGYALWQLLLQPLLQKIFYQK
jgi:lysophospholipase L1-like esterase